MKQDLNRIHNYLPFATVIVKGHVEMGGLITLNSCVTTMGRVPPAHPHWTRKKKHSEQKITTSYFHPLRFEDWFRLNSTT